MNLRSLKFADATIEQFEEFWEGEGFSFSTNDFWGYKAIRVLQSGYTLMVNKGGRVFIFETSEQFETFGEAADALNELANTKIMGGWK